MSNDARSNTGTHLGTINAKVHLQVPDRYGGCEACGRQGSTQVHHLVTRGAGGSDDPDNLIRLCIECHSRVHRIGRDSFAALYGLEDRLQRARELHFKSERNGY